jgi:hypothetical protein
LAGVGLAILDAVPQRVYGGALRVFARANASTCTTALEVIAREGVARIDRPQGLEPLGAAVERARVEVVRHLAAARAAGRRVIGYGAPARSITFLNALGIGPNLLPFVVDRAPAKQGRSLPGVRIPIRSPDALTDEVPDEVLILTWDLVAEVRAKLATLVPAATRFLIAVPGITDVTADDCGSGRPPASAVVL